MNKINVPFFLVVFLSAGCGTTVVISPLPYDHPANPEADAGSGLPESNTLEITDAVDEPMSENIGSGGHQHGRQMNHGDMQMKSNTGESAPIDARYTCSMHPAIDAPKAGKCPKCGMRLHKMPAASNGHSGGDHAN